MLLMRDIRPMIHEASSRFGIPRSLLQAIIDVESAGVRWATRAEPGYRWLWDIKQHAPYRGSDALLPSPRGVTRITELQGQRTSWGLMQVMGATAREQGFDGTYLTELVDPETNLYHGCLYLRRQYRRYEDWESAVAAYNAGQAVKDAGQWRNHEYVARVKGAGGL